MMLKSLFVGGALLLSSLTGLAQASGQPFLKISHLGTASRPIPDLYLATQTPELDAAQGLDGRYRFESVCLLTEAELTPLLRYTGDYIHDNKGDSKNTTYGTFKITLGPDAAPPATYTRTKALAFLNGAAQVLQKHAADPDTNEALHRLRVTVRRLSAPAK